jgi:hypothetical protein
MAAPLVPDFAGATHPVKGPGGRVTKAFDASQVPC